MKFLFLLLCIINVLFTRAEIEVIDKCTSDKYWALTFDDGPYIYDENLLDYLKSKNIKATFFVNGNNQMDIRSDLGRKIIKRMYEEGHNIENHTYNHINFSTHTIEEIIEDIVNLENAIEEIIGVKPAFIGLPYSEGVNDKSIHEVLQNLGYTGIVKWNIETKEWENNGNIEMSIAEFKNVNGKSVISLNHSFYEGMQKDSVVNLVKAEIEYMLKQGYKPVTISECTGHNAYKKSKSENSKTKSKSSSTTKSKSSTTTKSKSSTTTESKSNTTTEPKVEYNSTTETISNSNDTKEDNSKNELDTKYSTTNEEKPINELSEKPLPNSNLPEAQSSAISLLSVMHISSIFYLKLLLTTLILCILNICL